jgi:hypothetical protein
MLIYAQPLIRSIVRRAGLIAGTIARGRPKRALISSGNIRERTVTPICRKRLYRLAAKGNDQAGFYRPAASTEPVGMPSRTLRLT